MKYTKGKLTVKVSNVWPFDINTYDEKGKIVFSTSMPAYSTEQKTSNQCLSGFGFPHLERLEVIEANKIAVNDEIIRSKAPEMYEALKLAKKIIHSQMGKGLVLTSKDYNKMFDPIKEIEQ